MARKPTPSQTLRLDAAIDELWSAFEAGKFPLEEAPDYLKALLEHVPDSHELADLGSSHDDAEQEREARAS